MIIKDAEYILSHWEIVADMAKEYDLSKDERDEMWLDYKQYIMSNEFPRDNDNPFFQKWGIDIEHNTGPYSEIADSNGKVCFDDYDA